MKQINVLLVCIVWYSVYMSSVSSVYRVHTSKRFFFELFGIIGYWCWSAHLSSICASVTADLANFPLRRCIVEQ
jgi:hypothetical protein